MSFAGILSGQDIMVRADLDWQGIVEEDVSDGVTVRYLYFEGGMVDPSTSLPSFVTDHPVQGRHMELQARFTRMEFEAFDAAAQEFLSGTGYDAQDIQIKTEVLTSRRAPRLSLQFIPIRFNAATQLYEKLTSFELDAAVNEAYTPAAPSADRTYADHSVLSSGSWSKIRVKESGIYRITRDDLLSFGLDASGIDPRNIRLYGNAGGMLPESNGEFRHDDLQENAIYVHGEEDGSFDDGDYILFYGMSPHTWSPVLGFFLYQVHYYDDHNYYYLTVSDEAGKRLETLPQASGPATQPLTVYNDYSIVEDESHNLIESGKTWYGDEFGEVNQRTYSFQFPNIVPGEKVGIKTSVANRTYINDLLLIRVNGQYTDSVTLTSIDVNSTKYAQVKKKTNFYDDLGPDIDVEIEYQQAEPGSRMWLNFINVNVISQLYLDHGQLAFRNLSTVAEGAITKFQVGNAAPGSRVWDVTNPISPFELETEQDGTNLSFVQATDSLREFLAFDGTEFLTPEFVSLVENQDLHGSGPYDMVIVTHPLFLSQAEELADLHRNMDGFTVLTVTPETIYNEFSSGKQDPTAIRDLLKMFYDRYEGNEPRYLLLFGDGSFDPKDRLEHNTNFIPTFQTEESWITATSYVVDDYFGLLDDDEGNDAIGYLDIGIGRLPVQTAEEAQVAVDKIMRYIQPEEPQFGNWRTRICIIADDEDGNLHLEQADSLSSVHGYVTPLYNQNKIYLDAFPQLKTPSGDKYPDVNERIRQQVTDGALIINYIGHGGTGGWAHERILQQNDMVNWDNTKKLPLFITATCEFSRFDEPELVSGGEIVLLNPHGGGIALFTTTRLAYSQSNFRLNQRLYARAFEPVNGEMPYLGDLIRESKPPGQLTTRNFVLLGDPALRLSYPKHVVKTLKINDTDAENFSQDTLMALQKVTVEGEIQDLSGNPVNDFNGYLYPVLFDKATRYKTIGNDPNSFPVEFSNQDKIIWQGKTSVTDGKFTFSFVIPLDISFNFGQAKLSYYAHSADEDASGFYNEFMLGGISGSAAADNSGPDIELYLNDTTFISGDLTHENPLLLAYIEDENGINQSQSGIGHNITLVLNGDYSNVMVMDPYFQASVDDFRKGYLEYPFHDLPNGRHTLSLKVWDSYNNSSTAVIEFVIDRESELLLSEAMNYPNPFNESTTFSFRHTRPGNELKIELTIFDLYGKYLMSYATTIRGAATHVPFLTWDGRDVNGARLPPGIYPYTLRVLDEMGQEKVIRQKLLLRR